ITGDLVMTSTSVTNIEVQAPGTTAGTDYDRINVTGAVTFDGTLNVTHLGGFLPTTNQQFQIISYGSRVGTTDFATTNVPLGSTYTKTFNATNLTLTATSAVAVNSWNTDSSGDWNTAGNWSLSHVPTSSELAIIDRGAANPTVTYSATGTQ